MDTPLRSVIVITEKFRAISSVEHAVLNNTQIVVAPHDRGLQGLTNAISAALKGRKANNIAFIFNSTLNSVQICLEEDQRLCLFNLESVKTCFELRNFFLYVSSAFLTQELGSKRVDFLACSNAGTQEAQALLQELRSLLGSDIEVSLSRELWGLDVIIQRNIDERGRNYRVGDVYYKPDKLRTLTASSGQSLAGFEKIRIVGKGAYGTAVLYRKKDDDSLVILKEINMHDLTAQERLLCLNEIKTAPPRLVAAAEAAAA
uniref:Protein kinase domain-containing protein n=1 Tax=Macrostomum lignano TaxID=282301 RepID=A0A1I8JEK6_9PLAT